MYTVKVRVEMPRVLITDALDFSDREYGPVMSWAFLGDAVTQTRAAAHFSEAGTNSSKMLSFLQRALEKGPRPRGFSAAATLDSDVLKPDDDGYEGMSGPHRVLALKWESKNHVEVSFDGAKEELCACATAHDDCEVNYGDDCNLVDLERSVLIITAQSFRMRSIDDEGEDREDRKDEKPLQTPQSSVRAIANFFKRKVKKWIKEEMAARGFEDYESRSVPSWVAKMKKRKQRAAILHLWETVKALEKMKETQKDEKMEEKDKEMVASDSDDIVEVVGTMEVVSDDEIVEVVMAAASK